VGCPQYVSLLTENMRISSKFLLVNIIVYIIYIDCKLGSIRIVVVALKIHKVVMHLSGIVELNIGRDTAILDHNTYFHNNIHCYLSAERAGGWLLE